MMPTNLIPGKQYRTPNGVVAHIYVGPHPTRPGKGIFVQSNNGNTQVFDEWGMVLLPSVSTIQLSPAWFVYNPQGDKPTHYHFTEQDALNEAKRLAGLNPGSNFLVLERKFLVQGSKETNSVA